MTAPVEPVTVEQLGAVRRVVLNRPRKLNALDAAMSAMFFRAVDDAVADPNTHVIIVSGAGRAFCSGADLSAVPAAGGRPHTASAGDAPGRGQATYPNAVADMTANRSRVENWLHLWSTPKPLIAQVHGYCLGLANEIVGCADIVVCGESARFGMPEAREFALPPTLGFWPVRIGHARTKELLWSGRLVDGQEAVRIGLADQVVSDEALASETEAIAARIADVPAARLTVVKQAVNSWAETMGVREAALRGAEYHALYHQAGYPPDPAVAT
ncbi:enoyl-CoA hydratase/isomerase family protein [Frankia gtarii]|uniref:enoyl-CoA hydratase/isomerase family protein n=1 Tax=Frankia gtarii TaxID=2950102 RepID=UPI0021BE751B|nr:enoyl-CoA hydratase-related protein [Frankia gtarii]